MRNTKHYNSECPVTGGNSFLWATIIVPLQNRLKKLLELREEYTVKYWIKELKLRNVRKDRLEIYNKINQNALYKHCESWWSIEQYCKKNSYPFYIIMMWLESDLAIIIWEKLMKVFESINVNDFVSSSFDKYNDASEYLIEKLTLSASQIIQDIWKLPKSEVNKQKLELVWYIAKDLWEKWLLTERLKNLLYRDWIHNTVKNFVEDIKLSSKNMVPVNKEKILEMLQNSKNYNSSRALSNIPLFSITDNYDGVTVVYCERSNQFKSALTKFQFKLINKFSKKDYQKEWNWEYSWCPLLYKKWKINWISENWIIAYEIKIAEKLCELINH